MVVGGRRKEGHTDSILTDRRVRFTGQNMTAWVARGGGMDTLFQGKIVGEKREARYVCVLSFFTLTCTVRYCCLLFPLLSCLYNLISRNAALT